MYHLSEEKKSKDEPVSRFWAMFFAPSVFALLWTNKMKKTQKWILLFGSFLFVWFVLDVMLNPILTLSDEDTILYYDQPNPQIENFLNGLINSDGFDSYVAYVLGLFVTVLYNAVVYVGSILVLMYYMHKWTTQYNFKNFGYKSKRDWKKANSSGKSFSNSLKDAGGKTTQTIKNISKKTTDNIPSDKIKDVSVVSVKKISDSIKNLASSNLSESQKRDELEKYYDMMRLGVISESDYEKKKAELLGV